MTDGARGREFQCIGARERDPRRYVEFERLRIWYANERWVAAGGTRATDAQSTQSAGRRLELAGECMFDYPAHDVLFHDTLARPLGLVALVQVGLVYNLFLKNSET